MRAAVAMTLAGLSLALAAGPASAVWHADGSGAASARASALGAGDAPTATVTGRNVAVAWATSGGTAPADGYVVTRYDAGGQPHAPGASCAGTVSALSCIETGVAPGQWRYRITPARAGWRGAASPPSAAVTVAAPSLTLAPATVGALPATLTGDVSGYLQGQTVTFRLDDPAGGPLLAATVTPSSIPAGGGAAASVTLPAGTADGAHTVYAVGGAGDVASTTIDVEAACTAPGDVVLPATRDAYVDSLLLGSNFGSATSLAVGPAYLLLLANQRALVGFDLPAVPARCSLTAATLRLYATAPGAGRTVEAWQVAGAWTEAGVTWSNQPSTTGSAASSASLSSAGWQAWDVRAQVLAMEAGANHGFLVKDAVDAGVLPPHQAYQSRDGTPDARDPQLVLHFE